MRVLVAWCPDWAVTAAGFPAEQPVAVIAANRVVVCSLGARAGGVRTGMRRREAQGRCASLVVLTQDPVAEARAFEPVVEAIATLTPAVEVTRPGSCALDARGPARYFGGEEALCRRVLEVARAAMPPVRVGPGDRAVPGRGPSGGTPGREACVRVGVADGHFAATLAARRGVRVPPGGAGQFLAPLPVAALGLPELADILGRLGIHTLGALAALPPDAVLARFGAGAVAAQRLAAGRDERALDARVPPEPLEAGMELDPPVERVDAMLAAAGPLAGELVERLGARGLACVRLRIEIATEHGEALARSWRGERSLGASDIVQRLRWQLDGWLSPATALPATAGAAGHATTTPAAAGSVPAPSAGPTAGITMLRLVVEEVCPVHGHQGVLLGGASDADRRAAAGLDRLRGLLGPGAAFTGVLRGGRGPADRVALVPWGEQAPPRENALPWPGHCAGPAPSLIFPQGLPAALLDRANQPVRVDARGGLSAAPARLVTGGRGVEVVGWAGPWPADERWWDPQGRRRLARMQVLGADGVAHLLSLERGEWQVQATYD